MIDEYLFEIREDYGLLEDLNVSSEEIEFGVRRHTRPPDDSEYILFIS